MIQNFSFVLVGILMVAFVLGLHRTIGRGRGSKTGPLFLGVAAAAFSALGVFTTCSGWCISGTIHAGLFFVIVIGALVGLPVLSRRTKRDDDWKSYSAYSIATAVIAISSFITILVWATTDSKTLAPTGLLAPWAGLLQRIFAGIFLLWVEVMSIHLLRISSRKLRLQSTSMMGEPWRISNQGARPV